MSQVVKELLKGGKSRLCVPPFGFGRLSAISNADLKIEICTFY